METRRVDPSQHGYECAFETPHGKECGLKSTLAILARVALASDDRAGLGAE